jgi:hypothetical protein
MMTVAAAGAAFFWITQSRAGYKTDRNSSRDYNKTNKY